MTQEKQEKKKEKKTVIVGKMNFGSSVMKSVKNGAVRFFSQALLILIRKTSPVMSNIFTLVK